MNFLRKLAFGVSALIIVSNAQAIPFDLSNAPSGQFNSYTSGDLTVSQEMNLNFLSIRGNGIYINNSSKGTFSTVAGKTFGVNYITISELSSFADDFSDTSMRFSATTQGGDTYESQLFEIANDINILDSITINGNDLFAGITDLNDITELSFWKGSNDLPAVLNIDYTSYDINTGNQASASVPEPASFALMALGLFGLGFTTRKRK